MFGDKGSYVSASLCLSIVKRRIEAVKVAGAVDEIVGMYAEKITSDGPAIRTSDRVAYYVANRQLQLDGVEVSLGIEQNFIFADRNASLHVSLHS